MNEPNETPPAAAPKGSMHRSLDVVGRVGNKVPHPLAVALATLER